MHRFGRLRRERGGLSRRDLRRGRIRQDNGLQLRHRKLRYLADIAAATDGAREQGETLDVRVRIQPLTTFRSGRRYDAVAFLPRAQEIRRQSSALDDDSHGVQRDGIRRFEAHTSICPRVHILSMY